jgi:hypothetical protein
MGEAKRRRESGYVPLQRSSGPRTCGGRTACCSIMGVRELSLPSFCRCHHVADAGCAIYPERPYSCRVWSCLWLIDQTMSDALRPDRCGVVFNPDPECIVANGRDIAVTEAYMIPDIMERHSAEGHNPMNNPELRRLTDSLSAKPGCGVLWRLGPDLNDTNLPFTVFRDHEGKIRRSHILPEDPGPDNAEEARADRRRRAARAAI